MAADLRPVQSYINLEKIDAESSEMVRIAKQTVADIVAEFKKTKGIELNLRADPSSIKATRQAIEELRKAQAMIEKSTKDLNRVRQEEIKQQLLSEKLATQRKKTLQEEAKLQDINTKAKERAAKASATEEKETNRKNKATQEAVRAYKALEREYVILKKVAEDFGASLGIESKQYIEAAKRANELNDKLKAIDAGIGNHKRVVGDYAKGFSGLSNSLNQISRELPAFANSVQTGFLAISNNLPIFFDEISKARKEIKLLREQGQETQGLLQRLGSAFFSFGTVLSIGVTLLTVYGKEIGEFFVSLFKGTEALDRFIERQKLVGKAFKETNVKEAFQDITKVKLAFEAASQGVITKKEALDVYNKTLGDTIGKASTLEEAEKIYAKNADNYVKATLFRAAAQLALAKAADAALKATENQLKKAQDFSPGFSSGQSSAPGFVPSTTTSLEERARASQRAKEKEIKKLQDEQKVFEDIFNELIRKSSEFSKDLPGFKLFDDEKTKANSDKLKAEQKTFDDGLLNDIKERNKKISQIEELTASMRIEARQRAFQAELDIINGVAEVEMSNEKATRDQILADQESSANDKLNAEREYSRAVEKINVTRNKDILSINRELEADLLDIKISSLKRQADLRKEQLESDIALSKQEGLGKTQGELLEEDNKKLTTALEKRRDFLQQDADIRLARLEEDYQREYEKVKKRPEKLQSLEEKTQAKRLKIQNETNTFLLQAELDYATDYLNLLKSLGFDVIDQEAKIASIRLKLRQQQNKSLNDEDENSLSKREAIKGRLIELALETKNAISSVIEGTFDRRKNKIQEEIDALQKKKQADIDVANSSIANEQERAAAIQTINIRAQAQKEQLELKQRKVDQERARFDRAKAIVDIAQNIAVAIAKELSKTGGAGLPMVAILGAIGAAQIAAVLARPIPKYAEGTMDHPGGEMIVGDGGKQEMVITPDGKLIVTPKIPTLMDAPKHSIVLPDAERASRMLALQGNDYALRHDRLDHHSAAFNDEGLKKEIIRLQQIIRNKREMQPYIKNGDIRVMMRNGQSWVNYLNDNL